MATYRTPEYYKDENGDDLLDKWLKTGQKEKFFGFVTGNIEKYIERYDGKNGLEDLEKARDYIDRLIEGVKYFNNDVSGKFSSVKIPVGLDFKEANLDDLLEKQQEGLQNMKDVNVCEGYIDKLWGNREHDNAHHVSVPSDDSEDNDFLSEDDDPFSSETDTLKEYSDKLRKKNVLYLNDYSDTHEDYINKLQDEKDSYSDDAESAESLVAGIMVTYLSDVYGVDEKVIRDTIQNLDPQDIEVITSRYNAKKIDKIVKKYKNVDGVDTDLIRIMAEDE